MNKIPLPTDSLYTTLALLGVALVILSFGPAYQTHKLNIDIIRASGELEELEMKKKWTENDRAAYRDGVQLLEKYKQWQMKPVQALNPNTEEAKLYSERNSRL